ncbi:hypothetical protein [Nocardia cyriacigeorgica]|uniref:hypothetical protein n=1 Tax=Nocardia cyriacigeorgica TaxID=135487 RepID=UPI002455FCAC|nr:hypothetical protein [Nocardia cyriacigeorgica]
MDAELDGQRFEELAGRVNTVRMFLPALMRTVEFGATSDGRPVLAAMHTLAEMLTAPRRRGVPARWLDARRIDHAGLTGGVQLGQRTETNRRTASPAVWVFQPVAPLFECARSIHVQD